MSRNTARFRDAQPETGQIEKLNDRGWGVLTVDERQVLVDGTLPGERVSFRRRRRNRRHDEADLLAVLEPSADRVEPQCDVFGTCGGCSFQHMAPAAQLARKQSAVLAGFLANGVEPEAVLDPLTASGWGYRRRARLGVKYVIKRERVLVGFRERGNPYITDMDSCPVLEPPCDQLIAPLASLVGSLQSFHRIPQIEVAVAENATALVFRILDPLSGHDLTALRNFAQQHNVVVYLQPGGLDTVAPLVQPSPALRYSLPDYDVTLEFEPTDFLQVNAGLNRQMVTTVVDWLAPTPCDSVLELFAGLGNFTLPLARKAGRVTAVEGDAGLVARAAANADRNALANVDCLRADLYADTLSAATGASDWRNARFDLVLLDPPRAGAGAVLPLLAGFGARRIVYVSCDPTTLALDAAVLVNEHHYRLVATGIMDMFPHTAHVETLAIFEPA